MGFMRRAGTGTSSALLLWLGLTGALGQGCAEGRRANGEPCLKDQDCLSGICSQLACAAAPELLDAEVDATSDGNGGDAAADAASEEGAADGPVDAPVEGPADVATGQ
jgi:hypothetical protein